MEKVYNSIRDAASENALKALYLKPDYKSLYADGSNENKIKILKKELNITTNAVVYAESGVTKNEIDAVVLYDLEDQYLDLHGYIVLDIIG